MEKSIKKRNWCFIVYPTKEQLESLGSNYDGRDGYGSVPDDWIEILKKSGLKYAISPLHDKDLLEDNSGKTKKPHYHVIVCYGNTTTFNNVKAFTSKLNAPSPQPLEQIRGYYRYLTHKDNPDKFQYDEKDIITGGGFNIMDYVELTRNEILNVKMQLQKLIIEKNFIEYADLMDYLMNEQMLMEYDIASSNTHFFDKYISSKRHSIPKNVTLVNAETGEILKEEK